MLVDKEQINHFYAFNLINMSFKTETCALCGNLFSYDDSIFGKQPEWGGGMLGGYICSNCTNQRRHEKHQQDLWDEDRRRQESDRIRNENEEDDRRRDWERQQTRMLQQQLEAEEKSHYNSQNPGEFECPNCLYITLKRNASRCPKCQGTVYQNYWEGIYQHEALEAEKRRLADEERERTRPAREAAERAAISKRESNNILSVVLGILSGLIIWVLLIWLIIDVIEINNHIENVRRSVNKNFFGLTYLFMWLLSFVYIIVFFLVSWITILGGWLFIPWICIEQLKSRLNRNA